MAAMASNIDALTTDSSLQKVPEALRPPYSRKILRSNNVADRSQSAKILAVKILILGSQAFVSEQHTNNKWAGPGYGLP